MKDKILFIAMCGEPYRPDMADKLHESFDKLTEVEVQFVDTKEELNRVLLERGRLPEGKNTGILLPRDERPAGRFTYHDFPCGPFSFGDGVTICGDGYCWGLPTHVLRDALELATPNHH
jgi:hypothetical protein